MCERAASATPRSRRKESGGRSTRFLNVGWEQRIQLYVPAKPRTRASATRRHLSGPEGSGGPPGGGAVGRVPGGSRAPLGSASASREAAWRPGAAAPPGSRPTFKSKWLKPQALGGRREPLPPTSCLRACPQEEQEDTRGAGTPLLERPRRASMGGGLSAEGGGGQRGNHA